jgi:hypothetical protein
VFCLVSGANIGGVAAIFKLASLLRKRAIFACGGLGRGAAALSFPRPSFQNRFPQPWRYWLRYAFPEKWHLPSREAFAENGNWRCLLAARTEIDVLFVFSSGPPDATARAA